MRLPPDFSAIANEDEKAAFLNGHPETVRWLAPGTRLFKWTKSISNSRGISPWWQFVEKMKLPAGSVVPGIQDFQERAANLNVSNRDFARARFAVTHEWNRMTNLVAIALQQGAWGYIGKAAGQRRTKADSGVYFIGGEYQVWVPGLSANDIVRISILPYLKPNTPFR